VILGADVGGTFTDLVLVDGDQLTTAKIPTSAVQGDAIATGIDQMAGGRPIDVFVHGTTVATNMLLERSGARTALVTDAGFEDVIEIGRQDRPSLYDPYDDRPQPLVNRGDRHGVSDPGAAVAVGEASAVAIALIAGHERADDERQIATRLRESGFDGPISLSSMVAPEFREYERTSTTVLNAYLTPGTSRYLSAMEGTLVATELLKRMAVMRSSGGLISPEAAAALPASILLSGPAGGVIATAAFADRNGHSRVVSFDMGGTSTDVCRIDAGGYDVSYEREIAGYVCRLPSAGVHTVGAGGGSLAWIDAGGSLRVGPQSAGANPGPACYGRGGTQATVTDANVVLGRIAPDAKLGGTLAIDRTLAVRAMEPLAGALGITVDAAARGILAIAEEVMAGAIRTVSIEQGADPRGAYLYAFGGAGGLHATALARSLGMAGVVVPPHCGVFSALGLLLAPPRSELAQSIFVTGDDLGAAVEVADALASAASTALEEAGHIAGTVRFTVDVRYIGQSHEIGVPWSPDEPMAVISQRFHDVHKQRNGFARTEDPTEIVTIRCTAGGTPGLSLDDLTFRPVGDGPPSSSRVIGTRHGDSEAMVLPRDGLAEGTVIDGPAIIEESEATTFVDIGERAEVMSDGSIEVSW
jgi:N-methylhydantoinase A